MSKQQLDTPANMLGDAVCGQNQVIIQNLKQNKLQKVTQYPHHKILALVNVLQILVILMFFLSVLYWIDISGLINSICVYVVCVVFGLFFNGIVRTFNKDLQGTQQIIKDYDICRKMMPKLTVYTQNKSNKHIVPCLKLKHNRQAQADIRISQCYDRSGQIDLSKIQFKKPYISIIYQIQTQFLNQGQNLNLKNIYDQYTRNLGDGIIQGQFKFEFYCDQGRIPSKDKLSNQTIYLKDQPRIYLYFVIVIAAISFLTYPVYFIIDKLFVERYKVKICKKIKL